jgi:RimJ/RimL family protein N-acetyltransferase
MSDDLPPQLGTERLLLRGWRADDLEAHAEMTADPEVMRFLGGPVDREQSWRGMAVMAGHWVLRGYGNWAVERKADGAFIGRAGLWNPEGWPGLEVGWTLARHAWGHGYATEAAQAAIGWSWSVLGAKRLISLIDHENGPSLAVASRLGMSAIGEQQLRGSTVLLYCLARPA